MVEVLIVNRYRCGRMNARVLCIRAGGYGRWRTVKTVRRRQRRRRRWWTKKKRADVEDAVQCSRELAGCGNQLQLQFQRKSRITSSS